MNTFKAVNVELHPRPWRISGDTILDFEGELVAGLFTGYGMQGGLLSKELAERVVIAVNSAGSWFGPSRK